MNKIEAFPLADGNYAIRGDTYSQREKLKEAGAVWDAQHRQWVASREIASKFAPIMVFVDVDTHCHEGIRKQWVCEASSAPGTPVRTSCGMCDSFGLTGHIVASPSLP